MGTAEIIIKFVSQGESAALTAPFPVNSSPIAIWCQKASGYRVHFISPKADCCIFPVIFLSTNFVP
jgi:hypothetical protein